VTPPTDGWQRVLELPLPVRAAPEADRGVVARDPGGRAVAALQPQPAAEVVVEQQRLILEIRQNPHLAEWLKQRVNDLERPAGRGADLAAAATGTDGHSGGGAPEEASTPLAVIPLDPAVQARLADIRARIAGMDAEAERVARLLVECEANLLGTISEQDEHRLGELFAEFAEIFDMHYQAVREVNQGRRGNEAGPAAWIPARRP
jgi:hypothetical protein